MHYRPQLATLVKDPPEGDGWLHEIKFDGYRIGCSVERGTVTLWSRRGNDWTRDFPEIAKAAGRLRVGSALIDGEVAVLLPDGRTSFQALQSSLAGERRGELVYFAFDLLELDGSEVWREPLEERKASLRRVVTREGPIRFSRHWVGGGGKVFREACRLGFEGLVSKRRDQPYRPGRSTAWLKSKCVQRQQFVMALREDKPAREVKHERTEVRGIALSHPERVVFPAQGYTKLDLARYHDAVADWEVPHLRGRPLTLVRCPGAIGDDCYFMKHSKVWAPEALRRVRIPEKTKLGEYLIADTPEAVIALVQMDAIEIHTWNTRDDDVERPDRIVIDLDPAPEVAWREVIAGARLLRQALLALRLRSFVKTTGGRGLHLVVPIVRERDWSECLAFSRALAEALERQNPRTFTTRYAKPGRKRKILLDYLRNNRTNTSIAAFSPRARDGAPVSFPIAWEELTPRLDPARFTIVSVPRRLREDPWKEYWKLRQRLTASALRAITGS
jgi:bifunctional non-homologous end joining protein LigD